MPDALERGPGSISGRSTTPTGPEFLRLVVCRNDDAAIVGCFATRSARPQSPPGTGEHPARERALDRRRAIGRLPQGRLSLRYLKIGGRWQDHEHWAITIEDRRASRQPA